MAGVVITGIKKIDRRLGELEPKLQRRTIRKAMRSGMKIVLKSAKSNAPKKTGLLKRSIKVRAGKRKKGTITIVVQTSKGNYKGEDFYGAFQEFGFRRGHRKLGNKRKQVPGLHFMERAYKSSGEQAKQTTITEIKKGIDQAIKGGV